MLGSKLKSYNMADPTPNTHFGDRDAVDGVAVPGLHEYYKAHWVQGLPSLDCLDLLRDCMRLILYNVQSHTTQEIWHKM
jgi:hypothetical protein